MGNSILDELATCAKFFTKRIFSFGEMAITLHVVYHLTIKATVLQENILKCQSLILMKSGINVIFEKIFCQISRKLLKIQFLCKLMKLMTFSNNIKQYI